MCVRVYAMLVQEKPEKASDSLELEIQEVVSHLNRHWEWNSNPLEERPALLITEPCPLAPKG